MRALSGTHLFNVLVTGLEPVLVSLCGESGGLGWHTLGRDGYGISRLARLPFGVHGQGPRSGIS